MEQMRWITWLFPSEMNEQDIDHLIEQMNGTIEYKSIRYYKNKLGKNSFVIFSSNENVTAPNSAPNIKIYQLQPDEILIPQKDFVMSHFKVQLSDLRVGNCTPTQVVIFGMPFYKFETSNPREKSKIYSSHSNYQKDWTHIVCFPIAPLDPNYVTAADRIFSQWGAKPLDIRKNHITACLITISPNEVTELQSAINETIIETNWSCSSRLISFPKLGYFHESNTVPFLFIEPEGPFLENIINFNHKLADKLHDIGLLHFEPSFVLHMTFLKSYYIPGSKKTFDPKPYIQSFTPQTLPSETPIEVRLVQRFQKDPDGFYLTISKHPLPSA